MKKYLNLDSFKNIAEDNWAYKIYCKEEEIDDFTKDFSVFLDFELKLICGQRCSTKECLFQEFANSLQFPSYFEKNWDAFDECIGDLDWLNKKGYVLFITNTDLILQNCKRDLGIFLDILRYNGEEWWQKPPVDTVSENPKPFYIIFHSELENEEKLDVVLKNMNLPRLNIK